MKRLVVKSQAGSLYYNDAERGLRLEPHEITPHQRRLLLERLHVYEDTGITPPEIMELKERDTAKIVNLIPFDGCDDDSDITYKAYCPICKRYIGILLKKGYKGKHDNFCRDCGQRLKWGE